MCNGSVDWRWFQSAVRHCRHTSPGPLWREPTATGDSSCKAGSRSEYSFGVSPTARNSASQFFSFQSFHIIFSQSSSNIVTCCKRVLCLQRSVMVQLCIPSYWNCSYLREIIVIWLNFTTGGQPLFEWSKVFQAWWDYNHNQNLPWCVASCIFSTNVCPLYGCYTHFHHHVLYAFGTSMHI